MGARLVKPSLSDQADMAPAPTPEVRESQLQKLAYDLAEKQLRDGTASAQVITQFLKSASAREKLELAKIKQEQKLLEARSDQMASNQRMEELYEGAINAMRAYGGQDPSSFSEDHDIED